MIAFIISRNTPVHPPHHTHTHIHGIVMDDEMRDKAREVFTALTSGVEPVGAKFDALFNDDFASWRVFFRAIKDLTADTESALAELSGNGFLARTNEGKTRQTHSTHTRARARISPWVAAQNTHARTTFFRHHAYRVASY